MLRSTRFTMAACAALAVAVAADAQELRSSLQQGTPNLQVAGPLAFGPEGILFVGDPQAAAIFAIDTGDSGDTADDHDHRGAINVQNINEKIAGLLGTEAQQIMINDLAVNPASGNVYLSVSRGRGPDAAPVLLRVAHSGKITEVPLQNVPFAKAGLPNAPADQGEGRQNQRRESITDLAYVDGRVIVAGLSNEEFASKLRSIPFPFREAEAGTSVEIYHGAHGKFETRSPVRTFVAYKIADEPHLLAAYTCTPLVKFPMSQLKAGEKIKGTTIAELGNRNQPLDMIVYQKDGKDYLLLANNSRGVMKVSTDNIDRAEGITKPISDKAGQPYETIAALKGVVQLDSLDPAHALVLIQDGGGMSLDTVALP